jgi:hypothetical protein
MCVSHLCRRLPKSAKQSADAILDRSLTSQAYILTANNNVVNSGIPTLYLQRANRRGVYAQYRGAEDEADERAVVAAADGGPHPRAVVVELVDAVVVHAAVVRARGLVEVARVVPLHRHRLAVLQLLLDVAVQVEFESKF